MLHARLFCEGAAYRAEHFTTTPTDRPLLAQFCANDPDILLRAAQQVAPFVDGVDLNLGCPQRIARRGRYGERGVGVQGAACGRGTPTRPCPCRPTTPHPLTSPCQAHSSWTSSRWWRAWCATWPPT